jgi:hypothetical protein
MVVKILLQNVRVWGSYGYPFFSILSLLFLTFPASSACLPRIHPVTLNPIGSGRRPTDPRSAKISVPLRLYFGMTDNPQPVAPTPVPLGNSSPEILTPESVAELLGVQLSYVFEKTRSRCANPLPSHSLGRYLRFFKHEVLAWLAAQPSERPKRSYRLSPGARKKLQQRNRQRSEWKAA